MRCTAIALLLGFVSLVRGAAPNYTLASVVNAATGISGDYAPNGIITIYGSDLSYQTVAATPGSGTLPKVLGGVSVFLDGTSVNLFFVSPTQINFLAPSTLEPGVSKFTMVREGIAGPSLSMTFRDTAPGFFVGNGGALIATHANGAVITVDSPAAPGEVVVLYAAGLGRTVPDSEPGRAATAAAPILLIGQFAVLLGGVTMDRANILYAGITPGFAGLYQVNLRLPPDTGTDPEVRAFIGAQGSPSYLKLPVRIQ